MIILVQDSQFDEVAPTPAAKVAYARAVEEACREVVVGFRTAADGDQVEQRAGCVGALARHPAVYTGAFLRRRECARQLERLGMLADRAKALAIRWTPAELYAAMQLARNRRASNAAKFIQTVLEKGWCSI